MPLPGQIATSCSDQVMAAIEAYESGKKVTSIEKEFNVPPSVLYRWLPRYGVKMRGHRKNYRKPEPAPNVKAAVLAYAKGEMTVEKIVNEFNTDLRSLYLWINRMRVTRRKAQRSGKAGQPMKKPFVYKCEWCGDPLSDHQVKARQKYCCRSCQNAGVRNARIVGHCQALGCGVPILDEPSPYCSWECFKAVMNKRF